MRRVRQENLDLLWAAAIGVLLLLSMLVRECCYAK